MGRKGQHSLVIYGACLFGSRPSCNTNGSTQENGHSNTHSALALSETMHQVLSCYTGE